MPVKVWYEAFKLLHKVLIENAYNPKFKTTDPDYVSSPIAQLVFKNLKQL